MAVIFINARCHDEYLTRKMKRLSKLNTRMLVFIHEGKSNHPEMLQAINQHKKFVKNEE